ncbi:hypothetical protein [uncultured Stenotrophomonas sp.]|uniref:hypothetical protein n=1 Tax=uncultured Stenotrophomonas sp. TaxID=165438 RepID=UPI0028E24409|nr:hypothetical protein [uncultured Stenotrophomonas sp.]
MKAHDIERYAYMWDGSQPGWTMLRIEEHHVHLALLFAPSGPTVREVAEVRSLVPALSELPAAQCHAALKGQARVPVGRFDCLEAEKIVETFTERGLWIEMTSEDASGYLPRNELTGEVLIIEDNDLAQAVSVRAIAEGVRINHV